VLNLTLCIWILVFGSASPSAIARYNTKAECEEAMKLSDISAYYDGGKCIPAPSYLNLTNDVD